MHFVIKDLKTTWISQETDGYEISRVSRKKKKLDSQSGLIKIKVLLKVLKKSYCRKRKIKDGLKSCFCKLEYKTFLLTTWFNFATFNSESFYK